MGRILLLSLLIFVQFITLKGSDNTHSLYSEIEKIQPSDTIELDSIIDALWENTEIQAEELLPLLEKFLEKCDAFTHKKAWIKANILKASTYRYINKSDSSIALLQRILPLIEETYFYELKATSYRIMAGNYYDIAQYAMAIEHILISIRICETYDYSSELAFNYYDLSLVYIALNNIDEAIKNLKLSYEFSMHSDKILVKADGLYGLGVAYQLLSKEDSAIIFFILANEKYTQLSDSTGIFNVSNNLAKIFKKQGKFDEAIAEFKILLNYDLKNGVKSFICQDYFHLAGCYNAKKNYSTAIKCLENGISIAQEASLYLELQDLYDVLSDVYESMGNYRDALAAQNQSLAYRDSLHAKEAQEKAMELEERFNSEKKETENVILRSEQDKNLAIIKYQKLVSGILISVLIVLLSIIFVFTRQYRNNKELNTKLLNANEKLSELNKSKDRFFSIISHDLKGPIGTIKKMVELMYHEADDEVNAARVQTFIPALHIELGITYNLLDNLLTWSKSQFKQIELQPIDFSLRQESDKVIGLLQKRMDRKNLKFENTIDDLLIMNADVNIVSALIRNLLSNAIKFTPQYGHITLRAQPKQNTIEVSVSDNGMGISEQLKQSLFKVGEYRSKHGTEKEKGAGLGLILCKEFVDMHKGSIWLESEVGKGSTFYFSLPQ